MSRLQNQDKDKRKEIWLSILANNFKLLETQLSVLKGIVRSDIRDISNYCRSRRRRKKLFKAGNTQNLRKDIMRICDMGTGLH